MSEAAARGFAIRVALFYGALFLVYGMHVPYFPVWLDWRGLSAGEISAVMAVPFFARLVVTPAIALAADRNGTHRRDLIVLSWLSLLLVTLLAAAQSFWPIFALAAPLMVINSTIMPLVETIAVSGVRQRGLDYGRMRLWGSLTFIIASFAGGLAVSHYGGGVGVWLIALGCAATVAAAHVLPRDDSQSDAGASTTALWQAAEPRALLGQPAFLLFLIAGGGAMAAHATFLTFGTLIWQSQGLSGTWIGVLWAIGVTAEIALFAVSGRIARRAGPARLLMLGASVSIVRWLAMAFNPPLEALCVLQLLHGVSYGITHIGAIHFIHDAVPRHASGSGQALYATVAAGVAMGSATLIAGWLYQSSSAAAYLAMAVIAAIALAAAISLNRAWSGRMLDLGGT